MRRCALLKARAPVRSSRRAAAESASSCSGSLKRTLRATSACSWLRWLSVECSSPVTGTLIVRVSPPCCDAALRPASCAATWLCRWTQMSEKSRCGGKRCRPPSLSAASSPWAPTRRRTPWPGARGVLSGAARSVQPVYHGGGAGSPCRKAASAVAFHSLLKSTSNQLASRLNRSRLLAAVTSSSSAPHATPMVTKLSKDRCWLMRPVRAQVMLLTDKARQHCARLLCKGPHRISTWPPAGA